MSILQRILKQTQIGSNILLCANGRRVCCASAALIHLHKTFKGPAFNYRTAIYFNVSHYNVTRIMQKERRISRIALRVDRFYPSALVYPQAYIVNGKSVSRRLDFYPELRHRIHWIAMSRKPKKKTTDY